MRSWKTPALLLATAGLCGLGSLFAQGPYLPSAADPMVIEGPASPSPTPIPLDSTPLPTSPSPVIEPSPAYESSPAPTTEPMVTISGPSEYEHAAPVTTSMPMESASTPCCQSTPVESVPSSSASVTVYHAPQVIQTSPVAPQSGCGCQSSDGALMSPAYSGFSSGGMSGAGTSPSYLMGSGSGVSSGLLSPNANSGGLHTRYPYYNYRHPWFYQGPPSQNVTIVW